VGHWIAGYNYFRAIIRKGRKLKHLEPDDDGGIR